MSNKDGSLIFFVLFFLLQFWDILLRVLYYSFDFIAYDHWLAHFLDFFAHFCLEFFKNIVSGVGFGYGDAKSNLKSEIMNKWSYNLCL